MMRNGNSYLDGRTALLTNETVIVPDHVAADPGRHDEPRRDFAALRADGTDVRVHIHSDQSDMRPGGTGDLVVWMS